MINPDDVVDQIGADAFRMYEMFMGAFDQAIPWSTTGARGCRKFIERVWRLQEMLTDDEGMSDDLKASVHLTIKKVSEDFDTLKFNTAIAQMMTLVNEMVRKGSVTRGEYKALLLVLSPVAPHVCGNRQLQGFGTPIYTQPWPAHPPRCADQGRGGNRHSGQRQNQGPHHGARQPDSRAGRHFARA